MAATAVSGSALSSQAGSGDAATMDVAANVADQASRAAKTKTGTERTQALSRASRDSIREQIAELRPKAESSELGGGGVSDADEIIPDDPREIAMMMLDDFGWDESQFGCLDELWTGESNWSVTADNPRSSAYGIPQALPGSKMASAGPDWETNPVTQITWGLGYIDTVYGDPCSANEFKQANNWY
ncbi:MAG: lytic transglycosylase domain-containing protein [Nocardioidaceae bacterium]